MTIGERIALKRKELGLSQEALGERMGVSRQSIYKWESDTALPEIEKLVKLGREFSVSVDWLLGQEDDTPEREELTPQQLRMVEEIVGRYLAAQAKPEEEPDDEKPEQQAPPLKKRRWPYVVAALVVICAISSLFSQVNALRDEYRNLQSSIYDINYNVNNVNHQIGSITDRVQEVLQKQNDLTAEQSAQVTATDYRANTVTIAVRALPRTFTEGMTAEFLLESGGESFTVPGVLGGDHAFTAEITVPLSDDIPVSVALLTGNQRQTQLLNEFFYLYSDSFPGVNMIPGDLWGSQNIIREHTEVRIEPEELARIDSLRLGLFRDNKLLAWYEQLDEQPSSYLGNWENTLFFRLDGTWTMEPGHIYQLAAVVLDEYGRERVYASLPVEYDAERQFASFVESEVTQTYSYGGTDPAGWVY